jgi:predicted flap endonuclease-1-like 5' DNA nuclease
VAVYTQVADDETTGQMMAVVMAVAAPDGIEVVGDEADEVAVMVTDSVTSEDDVDELEEEAVEGAIDTLLENAADEVEEVDVTIYAGLTEADESGIAHAAVVAIAKPVGWTEPTTDATHRQRGGPAGREPQPKDLERVEGIGPKIAALLIEHGIYDLAALAATPVERLREILGGAGRRFRLADPGSWPEQARLGAAGLWDSLAELQTRLRAGRKQ